MQPSACQSNNVADQSNSSTPVPAKSCLQGRTFKIITAIVAVSTIAKIAHNASLSSNSKMLLTAAICILCGTILELIKAQAQGKTISEINQVKQIPQPSAQRVRFQEVLTSQNESKKPLQSEPKGSQTISHTPLETAVLASQESDTPPSDLLQIVRTISRYIEIHKDAWHQQVNQSQENLYISSSFDLLRSVQCNTDGSILVHFNKKDEDDHRVGKGTYKTVSLAFNYLTGEIFASAALLEIKAKNEIDGHHLAQQMKALYVLPAKYTVNYANRKGIRKFRILTPYCPNGDLSDAIIKGTLTSHDKMRITRQLIDAVIDFQNKGLLHLDIKPSNIFLSGNEIWIGDLASFCKNDDISRKRQLQITSWYATPEYARALMQYKESKKKVLKMMTAKIKDENFEEERKVAEEKYQAMLATISEKYDIWSLGCTLYQLYFPSEYRLPWATSRDSSIVFEAILNLKENWLIEPPKEDSIHHLIWSMLRIDPAQRISHIDLKSFMDKLDHT